MTRPNALRFSSLLVVMLSFALAGATCGEQPVVSPSNTPAKVGGVEFALTGYEVQYLALTQGQDFFEYREPVLTVGVKVTNVGQQALTYSPTHKAQQMSETSTPLLYADPGGEATLPPATKTPIPGVFLQKGRLDGQVTRTRTIEPGASIEDVFVFEVPDAKSADLILSLPPSMHRGNVPVLFRMAYQYEEPKGPKIYEVGAAASLGPVAVTVTSAEAQWVKTKDSVQGEGFSADPLYRVNYKVENRGEEAFEYEPSHRDVKGVRGAALSSAKGAYSRVRLQPTTSAVGQVVKDKELGPGDSVEDFSLFELPDKDAESVLFEFPASHVGQAGVIRVRIPYSHEVPEKPEEIRGDDKKGEDTDD